MENYDNNNRGAIWKNIDKTTDSQPDFKGNLLINGVDFWVSAWKRKEGANPKAPALSFSVRKKEDQAIEVTATAATETEIDNDIPW
jgi:hypothetical protein